MEQWTEATRIHVDCQVGDVIVVNTRLWFHQTMIPAQDEPSVSYARDFWTDETKGRHNSQSATGATSMTNVDGLYATNDIEAGSIIFRESDMPDCEVHRSRTNPNCEVVELEDGENAIVSICPIAAGDFFCLPESSDEEEGEECEEIDDEVDEDDGGTDEEEEAGGTDEEDEEAEGTDEEE
jgi:hypothetical protein